jgi:hypothetical protein
MLKMDACDLVSFVLDLRTCHVNMNKRLTSFCARYVCTCVHVRVCWSQMRVMQVLLSHGSCGSCSLSHQHVEHFDRQDRLDRLHSMCDGRVDCLSGRAGRTVPDHVLPALCVANVSCDATTVRRRQCSVFHRRIDQHHRHCVVYPVLQVYAGLQVPSVDSRVPRWAGSVYFSSLSCCIPVRAPEHLNVCPIDILCVRCFCVWTFPTILSLCHLHITTIQAT